MSRWLTVTGPRNEEKQRKKQQNTDLGVDVEAVVKAVIDRDELKYAERHC